MVPDYKAQPRNGVGGPFRGRAIPCEPGPRDQSADGQYQIDDGMLDEVDFKWLMAGQGWWVNTTRLHDDPGYANRLLRYALASSNASLRHCAERLLLQHADFATDALTSPMQLA